MPEIVEWLQGVNLLRHRQRSEMQEERDNLEKQSKNPHLQHPGEVVKEMRRLDKQLLTQSPKTLTPIEKDTLSRVQKELTDSIRSGMVSHEDMRRNPPGAVHRHMQWEKANKKKIHLWKNIKIQLDPENADPDLSNLEMIRPHVTETGAATFNPNAQIPGSFAMTPQAKANWPAEMPQQGTVNSPLVQAQRREKTPEERMAFGARMKAARAAKKQTVGQGA